MAINQLGDGSVDGVKIPGTVTVAGAATLNGNVAFSANSNIGFYGVSAVAQRASNSTLQRTSVLSTATGTISVSTAAFNQVVNSLMEVMNTLAAYGLWSIS